MMINVNMPSELTDLLGLNLLNKSLPAGITRKDIVFIDLMGKNAIIEEENFKAGFIYKVIAALGYENFYEIENKAYCYNRAAKSALMCRLPLSAMVCTEKAMLSYTALILKGEGDIESFKKEIEYYIPGKIKEGLRILKEQNTFFSNCEHDWFTIKQTENIEA